MNIYYVYIMTNWNNKVMYIGVTNDLERRVYEHKHRQKDSFTKRYSINKLVYYEHISDVNAAIAREKQIKGWVRKRKDELVETTNPEWDEMSYSWRKNDSSRSLS